MRGHDPVEPAVSRLAEPDDERSGEGRDDRDGHGHRIKERTGDTHRQSERGDDEGELADLRERERRLDRNLQILPGSQKAERRIENLPDHHYERQEQNRTEVLHEHGRLDEHADRHEEDRSEQILDRSGDLLDALGLGRTGQNGPHDESAQGGREPRVGRHDDHAQTESQRHDEQRLGIKEAPDTLEESRNQIDAHDEPQHQKENETEKLPRHGQISHRPLGEKRREEYHQHDREQVFDHQHAEHERREPLIAQPQIVERLDDDRRRRHRQHAAQKNAVGRRPAEQLAGHEPGAHHPRDDDQRGQQRRAAHVDELLEADLQSQREKQEDDADLSPQVDVRHIGNSLEQEIAAAQKAGYDIAQHDGLLESFEKERRDSRHGEDQRQIGYQRIEMRHSLKIYPLPSRPTEARRTRIFRRETPGSRRSWHADPVKIRNDGKAAVRPVLRP